MNVVQGKRGPQMSWGSVLWRLGAWVLSSQGLELIGSGKGFTEGMTQMLSPDVGLVFKCRRQR
jgi:hypothetical protein